MSRRCSQWTKGGLGLWSLTQTGTSDALGKEVAVIQVSVSPRGIYLCGHSAGAHLAAMVLLANWTKHGVTPNLQGFLLFVKTRCQVAQASIQLVRFLWVWEELPELVSSLELWRFERLIT